MNNVTTSGAHKHDFIQVSSRRILELVNRQPGSPTRVLTIMRTTRTPRHFAFCDFINSGSVSSGSVSSEILPDFWMDAGGYVCDNLLYKPWSSIRNTVILG